MNNSREKFEAWAKPYYKEQQMSLNSAEHFARPNEYMMPHYQSAYEGWQAATEQSQGEIYELNLKIQQFIALNDDKDTKIFELERLASLDIKTLDLLNDEMLRENEALQAREKVMLEALEACSTPNAGYLARQTLNELKGNG